MTRRTASLEPPALADSGRRFWLAITRPTGAPEAPHGGDHRAYMREMAARGAIVVSGPAAPSREGAAPGGATVLRADSEAEAHRLMRDEPYTRNGIRTYELYAWDIRLGGFADT